MFSNLRLTHFIQCKKKKPQVEWTQIKSSTSVMVVFTWQVPFSPRTKNVEKFNFLIYFFFCQVVNLQLPATVTVFLFNSRLRALVLFSIELSWRSVLVFSFLFCIKFTFPHKKKRKERRVWFTLVCENVFLCYYKPKLVLFF